MARSERQNSLCDKLECPVCLDYLQIPIRQCVIGHSFCTKCIDPQNVKKCPECRSDILQTRNYKLEELIENMNFPCDNTKYGCKFMTCKKKLQEHTTQCQFRSFKCEGKLYCDWKCDWEDRDVQEHFQTKHPTQTNMQFSSTVSVAYNCSAGFKDLQLIPAHYHLFWYKHMIDVNKGKALWAFQLIGSKLQASHYYYEFEFFEQPPSVRKYKIIEYCHSDVDDINEIFDSEKCVAISLKALKSFVNDKDDYSFRFRIMKIAKPKPEYDSAKPIPKKPLPHGMHGRGRNLKHK